MTDTLVLFDIDATLIRTSGVGVRAMEAAGRELFGPSFTADGIDFAGRLDPLLLSEMCTRCAVQATPGLLAEFRAAYGRHLPPRLAEPGVGRVLPGVHDLLSDLRGRGHVTIGLLTGNFAETGALKLRTCGLDPDVFHLAVWGDDSPHSPPSRDHLPLVALDRFRSLRGREVNRRRVTVIGDTPHDARCARVNGCRSLGVATGRFTVEDLHRAGADRVVPDLGAEPDIADWLAHA